MLLFFSANKASGTLFYAWIFIWSSLIPHYKKARKIFVLKKKGKVHNNISLFSLENIQNNII
jgi:hypothetical protein